jgi:hypothetical protein
MTGMRALDAVSRSSDLRFTRKLPNLRIIAVLHPSASGSLTAIYIGDRSHPKVNNFIPYWEHNHISCAALTFLKLELIQYTNKLAQSAKLGQD